MIFFIRPQFSLICAVFVFILSAGLANALNFSENYKLVEVSFSGPIEPIVFSYINDGNATVTITSVSTSCGCVTAKSLKNSIQPGEAGSIVAVLDPPRLDGLNTFKINVEIVSNEVAVKVLTLAVRRTIPFTIDPEVIFWRHKEEGTAREIYIKYVQLGLKVKTIQMQQGLFHTAIKEVDKGSGAEISIKPLSTDKPLESRALIVVEDLGGNTASKMVLLRVLPAAPKGQ